LDVNKLKEEIKAGFVGDYQADTIYLDKKVKEYRGKENFNKVIEICSQLAFEIMPEEKRKVFKETLFINERRLDYIFLQSQQLANTKNYAASLQVLIPVIKKITQYFWVPKEEIIFFSFKNPFEESLAGQLFRTKKKIVRAPLDFSEIFRLYGFLLVEMRKYEEAVDALEKAVAFNPVNIYAYFETIEAYKKLKRPDMLLFTVKDALKIATSQALISHCYADLGYYCIEIEDYDSAICFYTESLLYADDENVAKELAYIAEKTNKKIERPHPEQVKQAFAKYGVEPGPNGIVINVAMTLGEKFFEIDKRLAGLCYAVAADLTNDPDIKEKFQATLPKRNN
jgi:tetratricopeptide (TPR) repeat protein